MSIVPEIASKKVSRDVISQLVRLHRDSILGKTLPVYDGRKSLFTAAPLPFSSKDFVIKLDEKNDGGSASGSAGCVFVNILLFYGCLLLICNMF